MADQYNEYSIPIQIHKIFARIYLNVHCLQQHVHYALINAINGERGLKKYGENKIETLETKERELSKAKITN